MTPKLRRALLISILVHLAWLLPFRNTILLPEPAGRAAVREITALLVSAPPEQLRTLPYESLAPPDGNPERQAAESQAKSGSKKTTPVSHSFSRSTATDDVTVTQRAAVPSGAISRTASPAAVQVDNVGLDGVRQYRMNLAREARRFKDYPGMARVLGWEGVAVVVVNYVVSKAGFFLIYHLNVEFWCPEIKHKVSMIISSVYIKDMLKLCGINSIDLIDIHIYNFIQR